MDKITLALKHFAMLSWGIVCVLWIYLFSMVKFLDPFTFLVIGMVIGGLGLDVFVWMDNVLVEEEGK